MCVSSKRRTSLFILCNSHTYDIVDTIEEKAEVNASTKNWNTWRLDVFSNYVFEEIAYPQQPERVSGVRLSQHELRMRCRLQHALIAER